MIGFNYTGLVSERKSPKIKIFISSLFHGQKSLDLKCKFKYSFSIVLCKRNIIFRFQEKNVFSDLNAVTFPSLPVDRWVKYLKHFVEIDGWFNVLHTTVTNFHITSIKNFVEFMVLRKVFVYQVEKISTNFCSYIFSKRRRKPNKAFLSLFVCLWCLFIFIVVVLKIITFNIITNKIVFVNIVTLIIITVKAILIFIIFILINYPN